MASGCQGGCPVRIPLSEAQRQLWVLSQIERGGNLAYHVSTSVELVGELDRDRLRQAIQRVIERHEALRTTIASDQEQIVWPASKFKVAFEDKPDSGEAMNLLEGPLFRANLVRRENGRHILSLTAHHIISDGASMALLVGEIADFYSGRNVPARPMQFREYLAAAAKRMESREMRAHRDYWLAQIGPDSPSVRASAGPCAARAQHVPGQTSHLAHRLCPDGWASPARALPWLHVIRVADGGVQCPSAPDYGARRPHRGSSRNRQILPSEPECRRLLHAPVAGAQPL